MKSSSFTIFTDKCLNSYKYVDFNHMVALCEAVRFSYFIYVIQLLLKGSLKSIFRCPTADGVDCSVMSYVNPIGR